MAKKKKEFFEVLALSRDDMILKAIEVFGNDELVVTKKDKAIAKIIRSISDDVMERIARKSGASMMDNFWQCCEYWAEEELKKTDFFDKFKTS